MRQKLVVVGNGMAPGRALDRLFEEAPDAYDVTIFNAEPRVNYDRIMLSPVLSGEKSFEQIIIHGDRWYVEHGVTLYKGCKVTKIDREARTVTAARRHRRALRQAHHRDRVAAHHHPGARQQSRRRHHLSRPRRRRGDAARGQVARQRRRDRRRVARARGGGRAQGTGHGRHRRAPDADADGAPARSGGGPSPAEGGRGARHPRHHQGQYQGDPRRQEGRGGAARRWHHDPGRARHHGGRHPRQCGPRQGRRPHRQSRHRGRRRDAHQRPRHFRARANAPRPTANAMAWSRRSTRWRTWSRPSSRATPRRASRPSVTATKLKVTGIKLFSAGDFAEARTARRSCCATLRAASTGGSC